MSGRWGEQSLLSVHNERSGGLSYGDEDVKDPPSHKETCPFCSPSKVTGPPAHTHTHTHTQRERAKEIERKRERERE